MTTDGSTKALMGRPDVERCPVATTHCVKNECAERCQMISPPPSDVTPAPAKQGEVERLRDAFNIGLAFGRQQGVLAGTGHDDDRTDDELWEAIRNNI